MLDSLVAIIFAVVVFCVGAGLTHFFVDWIAREKIQLTRIQTNASVVDSMRQVLVLSLLGGVISVLLLLFFMFLLPRDLGIGILIFLIVVALVWIIITLLPKPVAPVSARKIDYPHSAEYRKLLTAVGGDRGTANRLIEYERKKFPHKSFDELCKIAWERLIHDQ